MKIINLKVSNVKRVTALDITPSSDIVTIGGKNGVGKSSVLDAIAYALGGQSLVPAEPIRHGETQASIAIDLGDIRVTRKFKRDAMPCDCAEGPNAHATDCASVKLFSPTKSTLVVSSADGAEYKSPQAMLDRLLGSLTFDLTAVELELTKHPFVDGAPAEEIPIADLTAQVKASEEARKSIDAEIKTATNDHAYAQREYEACGRAVSDRAQDVEDARKRLQKAEEAHARATTDFESVTGLVSTTQIAADAARAKLDTLPDVTAINEQIASAEVVNRNVRANAARLAVIDRMGLIESSIESETDTIAALDKQKKDAIAAVKFPVDGLGFTDDGVTFNGVPFEQASTSEQINKGRLNNG